MGASNSCDGSGNLMADRVTRAAIMMWTLFFHPGRFPFPGYHCHGLFTTTVGIVLPSTAAGIKTLEEPALATRIAARKKNSTMLTMNYKSHRPRMQLT